MVNSTSSGFDTITLSVSGRTLLAFKGLLMDAGIKRAVIRQPEFAVVPGTSVARLEGPETVLNGGTEDE